MGRWVGGWVVYLRLDGLGVRHLGVVHPVSRLAISRVVNRFGGVDGGLHVLQETVGWVGGWVGGWRRSRRFE